MKNEKFSQLVEQLSQAQTVNPKETKTTITQALLKSGVRLKRRHHHVLWGFVTLAVAICLLTLSGMYVTPVNHVMAQIPIIGNFFAKFDDDLGTIVETNGKTQNLNQTRTSNGMKMTLKTVYVQGKTVAITGTISGVNGAWDDWFDFYIGRGGVKFSQSSADLRKISTGHYRFWLDGTIKGKISKSTIKFPIVFTRFKGHAGRWAFNLRLAPSKVSTQKLTGNITLANGDVKLKLLGIDEYSGGTGLLKVQETQRVSKDDFQLFKIFVNGSHKDYMLANQDPMVLSKKGKQRIVGYRVKELPKRITKITVEPTLSTWEVSARTALSSLPTTIKAKRTTEVFRFKKPTLRNGKLTLRYYLTGSGLSSDRELMWDKGNQLNGALAIMAKTYHDDGNASVYGKDYLYEGRQKLINGKTNEFEATYNLTKKSGLKNLNLNQLQLQIDYDGLHSTPRMKEQTISVKQN